MVVQLDTSGVPEEIAEGAITALGPFALNVVASLVAALVVLGLGAFVSRRFRSLLTAILGSLTGSDLQYVYKDRRDAHSDMLAAITDARKVLVFTGKGSELQRDTFEALLSKRQGNREVDFRVLLPTTKAVTGVDWTAINDRDLGTVHSAYGAGLLQEQIRTTIAFLLSSVTVGLVEVRQYSIPHICRVIITDRHLYFVPYRDDGDSRVSPVYRYRVGGATYECYHRLFSLLWENAPAIKGPADVR